MNNPAHSINKASVLCHNVHNALFLRDQKMPLRHILIASDFSKHAGFALQRAIDLAEQHKSSLYFVHVLDNSWMTNSTLLPVQETQVILLKAKQESERNLQDLLKQYSHDLPTHVAVLAGRVADEILRYANENKCELIVAGAHGKYYINDYVLGTTSGSIVKQGKRPVLLIKKEPVFSYKRILIATDFSETSKKAIEFTFNCFPDATFQLLHIVDVYYEQFLNDNEQSHKTIDITEKFDDFLKSCHVKHKQFETKIIGGYFADAIIMQSEKWQADLLAFGTQGHSQLHYFLMGSVAKRLMQLSRIDMLAVPPARE